MNKVVSLNFLYKPKPYKEAILRRAECWINFFLDQRMHVIGTAPVERKEDLRKVKPKNGHLFTLLPVMSFDTCDRWRAGLSKALEEFTDTEHFFLWSADFVSPGEESKESSKDVEETASMKAALELINYGGKEDLVVGTIEATGTKQAIDQYASYPLLQNWFPKQFELMMREGLLKPRSELLRLSRRFLEAALKKRWYPTEQTIHLILQCLWSSEKKEPYTVAVRQLPKIPDDLSARTNLNAVQQLDRMELWLKYIWRDRFPRWLLTDYVSKCKTSFEIMQRAYNALEIIILNEASF